MYTVEVLVIHNERGECINNIFYSIIIIFFRVSWFTMSYSSVRDANMPVVYCWYALSCFIIFVSYKCIIILRSHQKRFFFFSACVVLLVFKKLLSPSFKNGRQFKKKIPELSNGRASYNKNQQELGQELINVGWYFYCDFRVLTYRYLIKY